jgi:hypothetical protein
MQACLIRDKRTWQLLKDYRKDDSGARLKTVTSIKVPTLASAQGCRISSPYPDKMPSFRFEHNLTRPYPFKWYTPAVLAGFTIATIIFSVLNYASTGYTLQAAYLPDPRPTSWPGMDSWYKNWPASLVGGNKPSCQPASIPIGSTLFTNNTALPWRVDYV